jgi:hypothetical protein
MLTDTDWLTIEARITANWPHQLPPKVALAKWKTDLADLRREQVETAVEALYRDGREFPPNGGQIRAKVVELTIDAPDWADVKHYLAPPAKLADGRVYWEGAYVEREVADRARRRQQEDELARRRGDLDCPHGECDGTGTILTTWIDADYGEVRGSLPCRCETERKNAWKVRVAQERAAAHPLIQEFEAALDAEDRHALQAGDRTAEAQTRTKWEQFVAGQRRDATYAGLPDAGLPAIERANRKGFARIGDALRRVLPTGSESA